MKNLTVMLSACGAQFAPGLVRCLKDNGERDIRVIGIDMHYDPTLESLYDAIYEVPRASDEHYIDRILEICRKENVNVVLPFMSAELIPLLDRLEDFEKVGVKVAVGDRHSIEITTNKFRFYAFLKEHGLKVPKFAIIRKASDLKSACEAVGYPEFPVCVKATELSGSRGIRMIDKMKSRFDILFNEKPNSFFTTFEDLQDTLNESDEMPEMMAMEYLPGEEGSVDLIADNGKIVYMAYRESNVNLHSIPQEATLVYNEEAYQIARDVVKSLCMTGSADFDFKYDRNGHPVLMEINPRIAATMQIFKEGGLNLPYLRIKQLLGEELPKVDVQYGVKMKRRYLEMFANV
ncbi:ATP-grasp domain-containing protein [Bacteroides pyogenes]|uniref:ATP-grasp domain-containing protein n=1 Tax=Bacteroides pyogenes TaxID=310300 RepID=UPI0011E4AFC1|nr:ATP-grasp domain-containing protein [Bacteroides pyogenes]TYK33760.1 ATP-grasp domain-containing protein [Bacteroides pyogenes]